MLPTTYKNNEIKQCRIKNKLKVFMKTCENGHIMPDGATFCPQCGKKECLTKICPKCRTTLQGDEKFCANCGTALKQTKMHNFPKAPVVYKTNKKIVLRLLFVFLGACSLGLSIWGGIKLVNSLKGDTSPANAWVEVGSVVFSNEYGVTDPQNINVYKFFGDELDAPSDFESFSEQMDYNKQIEEYTAIIRVNYFQAENLSKYAKLFRKVTNGVSLYEVRATDNSKKWTVQRGTFVTKNGDLFNARVLCKDGKYQSYCYFNIDD